MLITALIAAVISIAAGASIRAWAFAIFAFLVAIGFGGVVFVDGSSAVAAIGSGIAILVLMEIGYLSGREANDKVESAFHRGLKEVGFVEGQSLPNCFAAPSITCYNRRYALGASR